mgnify:CR=1 FL=1
MGRSRSESSGRSHLEDLQELSDMDQRLLTAHISPVVHISSVHIPSVHISLRHILLLAVLP